MRRADAIAVSLSLLMLAGCSSERVRTVVPPPPPDETPKNPQKAAADINTDLIRGLLVKGQYYAALAYVEDQRRNVGDSDELKLLEADARRNLKQKAQAEALYRGLIGTAYEADARHGLGLLYATAGQLDPAIKQMRIAAELKPTDVEIRNDLGYALMQAGRYSEAMPELSTAAELAPNQTKARNNLIILMLLTGNEAAAQRLGQQSAVTSEMMARLRLEAQAIQTRQQTAPGRG